MVLVTVDCLLHESTSCHSGLPHFFSNICGHVYAENIGDHDDKEPFYDDNMGYFWDNSMMIIWDIYVIIL